MPAIEILKPLHIALVLISLSGFALRGWWMLRGSPLLQRKPVKVLPHIIDTLLLLSGVLLAWLLGWSPLAHAWLAAKLLALLAYIISGAIALKRRSTGALLMAGCFAAYMLYVAVSKQVLPFS